MNKRRWLQLLTIITTVCAAHHAVAIQQTITASQDTLLDQLEQILPAANITVINQATTDKFALIYARQSSAEPTTANTVAPHLTITLRQLPDDLLRVEVRTDVSIVSDSPKDKVLEATLLRELSESLSTE